MNKQRLVHYFDHTFLKAYATETDLKKLCEEAGQIGAEMVAVEAGAKCIGTSSSLQILKEFEDETS